MRLAASLTVLLVTLSSLAVWAQPATQPDLHKSEKEVRDLIDRMIVLLEDKDYASAFRLVAGPVAEKSEKDGQFDHAVEVLKAGMGDELLKGLKAAKEAKAAVDADGQTVIFDIADAFHEAPKMSFKKWQKGWYMD